MTSARVVSTGLSCGRLRSHLFEAASCYCGADVSGGMVGVLLNGEFELPWLGLPKVEVPMGVAVLPTGWPTLPPLMVFISEMGSYVNSHSL